MKTKTRTDGISSPHTEIALPPFSSQTHASGIVSKVEVVRLKKRLFGIFLIGCIGATSFAADHQNLEEGLPASVEDAYPIAYRGVEIQSMFRYDRTHDDKNRVTLEPRIELGIAPNTEFEIRAPFHLGNADRTGSGNTGLGALYNFNVESLHLPAFALAAEGEVPTGKSSDGFDTTLKFIITKTISKTGLDRIHLNLAWKHNAEPKAMERENFYVTVLGYSRRLNPDTILVADFVREQERERGENSNIVEVGIRRQITPLTLIAIGLGAGIGEESPDFRATTGFQKSF